MKFRLYYFTTLVSSRLGLGILHIILLFTISDLKVGRPAYRERWRHSFVYFNLYIFKYGATSCSFWTVW